MEGNDILIACTIGDLAWLKRSLVARSGTLITAGSLRNSEVTPKNCNDNDTQYDRDSYNNNYYSYTICFT